MNKLIILGLIVGIVVFIGVMPYIKWIFLLFALKLIVELIFKFRSKTKTKEMKVLNPIKGARMCFEKASNRLEQGFDTPKVPLGKIILMCLGVLILLIVGKGLFEMITSFLEHFKYILIAMLLLLAIILFSRARSARPITVQKVVRRINYKLGHTGIVTRHNEQYEEYGEDNKYSDSENIYEDVYEDEYKNRYYDYIDNNYQQYREPRNRRYTTQAMNTERFDNNMEHSCIKCRYYRNCNEEKRRVCNELANNYKYNNNERKSRSNERESRSKRMEYM